MNVLLIAIDRLAFCNILLIEFFVVVIWDHEQHTLKFLHVSSKIVLNLFRYGWGGGDKDFKFITTVSENMQFH